MNKRKFWKKWWFWALIVVVLIGGAIEYTEPKTEESTAVITETTTDLVVEKEAETEESQIEETSSNTEVFIESIRDVIKGEVGENEYITDIVFENGDLRIYVDFGKTDPTPLTMEDLAILRTASIMDKILEFVEYDDLWQTITIDFKDFGYIRNDKQDIKDSEYGRYFPQENFKLELDADTKTQEGNEQAAIEKNIREAIEKVVTEEMLEIFDYAPSNNFSLIKFKGSENLTNNMTVKGMYLDIFNILKAIQPIIDTDVDFNVTYPLVDQYGNTEDVIVIKATFTNETIKKINFENTIWGNIPIMADNWWNHSAVSIANE